MAASEARPETYYWRLRQKNKEPTRRPKKEMMRTITLTLTALIAAAALSAATDAGDPVAATDRAFVQAYEKGNLAAVKKYLDADFTWIDTDGVFYSKDDALALGVKLLVPQRRRREDCRT
jgi:hypothetical protein